MCSVRWGSRARVPNRCPADRFDPVDQTLPPLHVSYFYDLALPSQYAAPIQILNTCHALAAQGVPVTVYTGSLTRSAAECLAFYGLEPHPLLKLAPLYAGRPSPTELRRRIGDAIECGDSHDRHIILSRGEAGIELFRHLRKLPRTRNRRDVYEAHRLSFVTVAERLARKPSWRRWAGHWRIGRERAREAATLQQADGLLCLTEGVRAALASEFRLRTPTLVLPSGTALPPPATRADDARDIDLLYVGKLERRKGVFDLVRAMRWLPGRRVWIVGGSSAEVEGLRDFARHHTVLERIHFTGYLPQPELRAVYGRARVGVCPLPAGESRISEEFTSPLKILEMMRFGVPVVATDLPSVREMVEPDRTALLTPPSDPEALAAGIERLLLDRAEALRLAGTARQRVEDFSWDARARRLREFLESLP